MVPDEIPVLHFRDALALVGAPEDEPDLAPEHERALGAWALAEHGSDFLAVEGYPMAKRPFYTHPQPDDPRWSNSFDLSSAGSSWSPADSGCTGPPTTTPRSGRAARTRRVRGVPAGLPARDAAARRLRDRAGAVDGRLAGAANVREVTLFPRDLNRLTP